MAGPDATGRALVPFVQREPAGRSWMRAAALVALFGLTAGVGGAGTYAMRHLLLGWGKDPALASALRATKADVARLASGLDQLRAGTGSTRADEDARALRRSVEALKAEVEQLRAATGSAATQVSARLDRLEREPAAKLLEVSARLDRIERDGKADKASSEAGKDRTAELSVRVEHPEKQEATPPATGSIPIRPVPPAPPSRPNLAAAAKPPAPAPASGKPAVAAAAAPAGKAVAAAAKPEANTVPPARSAVARAAPPAVAVKGWMLRDVYDGVALVEARGGRMREVEPGQFLPGAGEVRSIERRGRGWVVLTSRGVIDAAAF